LKGYGIHELQDEIVGILERLWNFF
jgi:hypothetical protein